MRPTTWVCTRYARHSCAKIFWACLLGLGLLWGASSYAAEGENTEQTVYVLAFTDFHGRLHEGNEDPGIAKFMGAVRAFQSAHPHSLLLAAGDLFTGPQESDMLRGLPTYTALRAINLAASAVGNHEFDWERSDIAQWSRGGVHFLSANVKDAQGQLPPGIEDGRIFTVGTMRIGVAGLSPTSTARTTKQRNVGHLLFIPPAEALAPVVSRLRKEGAEAVIVLAHLAGKEKPEWKDGIAPIIRKIAQVPGVTAVVYGHSHEEHLTTQDAVPIVQPAYRGRSLAVIALTRDDTGKVLSTAAIDKLSRRKQTLPVDKEGLAITRKAVADLEPAMQRVVAHASRTIPLDIPPTMPPEGQHSVSEDISRANAPSSSLGQLIGQAMLDEVGGEVAILNTRVLHAPLRQGPIREIDLYTSIPAANRIMRLEMTGKELAQMLHAQCGNNEGEAQQIIGIALPPTQPHAGTHTGSLVLAKGTVIEPNMTVRVLLTGFPVQQGSTFPQPSYWGHDWGRNKVLLEIRLRDIVRDWLIRNKTL